ncbi:putative ribonuclease H-like domain-containing protein [Tanacetum coccineum]
MTSGILTTFITDIENQINHKVKIIRCDNGTGFKNNEMNQRERIGTLIEALGLASSIHYTYYIWVEAVNTACYVHNRVLVTKPHNKTPYELLLGRPPSISFIRPFGCLLTILNTLDPLGKFDGKVDEGFLVGYSINSKAFRVFNSRTRKVEENMHINFLENKPNVAGSGLEWLFNKDSLTKSMNYEPITVGNQTNGDAGIETNVNTGQAGQEKASDNECILLPLMLSNSPLSSSTQSIDDKDADEVLDKGDDDVSQINGQEKEGRASNKEDDQHVQDFRTELDRIEAIRLFLAYASFMGFIVYQMDVKSAFLYGTIEEEVYVCQPLGFEDPQFPDKVYKVEKALYGLHQAPKAWYETLSTYLIENGFRRGTIDKTLFIKKDKGDILFDAQKIPDEFYGGTHFFLGLQVQQKEDVIFISQDKYVAEILKKFDFATVKTISTPIETNKALVKDEEAEAVYVHLYRSMIGSLMYLTASRHDIMFVVCACARFQVTPKTSHIHAVKRIFRYLKCQPKLGLWYPRDSPFDLEAFLDSDYAGASLDRKSTTGGCQFFGKRLILWQCKKQTIVVNSTTEAEYVVAANCCG